MQIPQPAPFCQAEARPGKGQKESLRSVDELLKWADRYQEKDMPEIRSMLAQYSYKVVER